MQISFAIPLDTVTNRRSVILEVTDLSKTFLLKERGVLVPSVASASFTAQSGRLTALVGPSGAGKTSILKCIYRTYLPSAGLLNYFTGSDEWINLATASEEAILNLRRTEISFVTQFLHFLPRQSTLDVTAWPLVERGCSREESRLVAAGVLAQLDIPKHLWEVSPATLSGGEKQRVNIARGFVAGSRLLLLDEPTASLDPRSVGRVVEIIATAKGAGAAIAAVFHDPKLIEALADEVVTVSANAGAAV